MPVFPFDLIERVHAEVVEERPPQRASSPRGLVRGNTLAAFSTMMNPESSFIHMLPAKSGW